MSISNKSILDEKISEAQIAKTENQSLKHQVSYEIPTSYVGIDSILGNIFMV